MGETRGRICSIISKMLDNPDDYGIYPTTKCYDEFEEWISGLEFSLIGTQAVLKRMKESYGGCCKTRESAEKSRDQLRAELDELRGVAIRVASFLKLLQYYELRGAYGTADEMKVWVDMLETAARTKQSNVRPVVL